MESKIKKNLERVQEELVALKNEYVSIFKRFKYVTIWPMKTRVPANESYAVPKNNDFFHLCVAFVEELFDKAPRTCAYALVLFLIIRAVVTTYDNMV